jgi:hypothetical protein
MMRTIAKEQNSPFVIPSGAKIPDIKESRKEE